MKVWEWIRMNTQVERSITEAGHKTWQINIQGSNTADYSDVENIASVKAVYEIGPESADLTITVDYHYEDAKQNVTVRKLVEEAREEIKGVFADDMEVK